MLLIEFHSMLLFVSFKMPDICKYAYSFSLLICKETYLKTYSLAGMQSSVRLSTQMLANIKNRRLKINIASTANVGVYIQQHDN